jgi:DNA repair exonuclease SbcCD ATPase subunit
MNTRLANLNQLYSGMAARKNAATLQLESVTNRLTEAQHKSIVLEKALEALARLTELKKRETTEKIEVIVTQGLQTILENPTYQFKIEESIKRKQVAYAFKVYSDEIPLGLDILEGHGGGVAAIVSFLLRILFLVLLDRKATRFLVLDESFAAVSHHYHDNLVTFVRELVDHLKVQLILVSHQPALDRMGDVVYDVRKQKDGVATVKRTV